MPLQIIRQDITKMQVDAIVNTTNEEKIGYSGVDLAIHTAAGIGLDRECATLPPLGLGQAQITGGYDLPSKYVIHTSGPIWRNGLMGESAILRSCYLESLKLAVKHGCQTVAFPLISSGVYGYPKDQVLKFAIQVITEFLYQNELTVYLCVFDKRSYTFSQQLFYDIKAFIDDDYAEQRQARFFDMPVGCELSPSVVDPALISEPPKPERRRDIKPSVSNAPTFSCSYSRTPVKACDEAHPAPAPIDKQPNSAIKKPLDDYLKQMDKSFQETLFELIDRSGMTDVECYKKANVDKRVFSKIKSNKDYRPSKQTAVAFAIALRLSLDETQHLLSTAGMTLSRSNVFDKIIRYFIHNGIYDIFEINEALFEFDQVLLGSCS